jgi:drug/metabolite transporter (DMT)-like permease
VLIKLSIDDIPPLTFAGLRYTFAAMILLPGLRKHQEVIRALSGKDWWRLLLLGLVFYSITQGGQFVTLNYLEAITFSLLLNFTTVIVAVFGVFGWGERPTLSQWGGIIVFVAGVLLYFRPSVTLSGTSLGYIFAAITVGANAIASILGRSVNRQGLIPPIVVTVISMGFGAIILLTTGFAIEGLPTLNWATIGIVLWLAVVNTAFAFLLWNKTLQVLTAVESSIINNTMLVQIAILAWLFLGEDLGLVEILGLALATIGVFLANIRFGHAKAEKDSSFPADH